MNMTKMYFKFYTILYNYNNVESVALKLTLPDTWDQVNSKVIFTLND